MASADYRKVTLTVEMAPEAVAAAIRTLSSALGASREGTREVMRAASLLSELLLSLQKQKRT